MINHLRTLLLNQSGDTAVSDDVIGEELVPADYHAVSLSTSLTAVRAVLFGRTPDRSYLNYRLAQYLALLQATEQQAFVTALDSRLTYDALQPAAALGNPTNFMPVSIVVKSDYELVLQGAPAGQDGHGWLSHRFNISLSGSTITVQQLSPATTPPVSISAVVQFSGGYSQPIPLCDSGYSFLVPSGVSDGDRWQITVNIRPQVDLGQVAAALKQLSEPVLLSLFGVSPAEPYKSFANWFRYHPELPQQLGGVLLTVAWRTDALRMGN